MLIEVVCYHLEAVKVAISCKVDRIELCCGPLEGGLTPSQGLVKASLKMAGAIPIHVMLRCREGNFIYTDDEKSLMMTDLDDLLKAGVSGIVVGALQSDHRLDLPFLKAVVQKIRNHQPRLKIIFHRAFDVCLDPDLAIDQISELGFDGVLTSGRADQAISGLSFFQTLKYKNLEIIAASGINSKVIQSFLESTSVRSFHLSAIPKKNNPMQDLGMASFLKPSPHSPDASELIKCVKTLKAYDTHKS